MPIEQRDQKLLTGDSTLWLAAQVWATPRVWHATALLPLGPTLISDDKQVSASHDALNNDRQHGLPDAGLADTLGRHGIKVSVSKVKRSEPSTGEEIRRRAVEQHADLLVLGAYGHSRFREFAFGGVTRHISQETNIPVLFSH